MAEQSKLMTTEELAAVKARAETARRHVSDLAAGRKRWTMCVPVQDDDSDVVLAAPCDDVRALLAHIAALEAERAMPRTAR